MGLERGAFKFGGTEYPLTDDTANALLLDVDPAVYWCLALLGSTIETYLGDRFVAQAALNGLALPGAVVQTKAVEPVPTLFADGFQFPLLSVYRRKDVWNEQTIAYDKSTSTWELAYVLPPLMPAQIDALQPILRGVSVVARRALHMGSDPAYRSGEDIWALAGIQKAQLLEVTYGEYSAIDEARGFYRAITGTITVLEREQPLLTVFDDFDGADVQIDAKPIDEPAYEHVADLETHVPPTLTSLNVTTGTSAGGTAVTLTGTGFRVGTHPRILFDGADADAVVVVSATSITCRTPAHTAYPSFLADVAIVAADGQTDTLADAFTFTTA